MDSSVMQVVGAVDQDSFKQKSGTPQLVTVRGCLGRFCKDLFLCK